MNELKVCDIERAWTTLVTSADDILVIGTLFKHQPLKPNILAELSEDAGLQAQPILSRKTKFISEQDEIILEDELQRIKLVPAPGRGTIRWF